MNPGGSSSSRADRKTIEKMRRNYMKELYAKLNYVLPGDRFSREQLSIPDQLDAAAKYIKELQVSVERMKERRNRLVGIERSSSRTGFSMAPKMEIHETGSGFQVNLITGFDHKFLFYEMIRVIHDEGGEVVSANFSEVDDSTTFHTIHSKVDERMMGCNVGAISDRLKKLVQDAM